MREVAWDQRFANYVINFYTVKLLAKQCGSCNAIVIVDLHRFG